MLTKKDYFLVALIGLSFAVFAIPILKNINLDFFPINTVTISSLIIIFVVLAPIALWFASIVARKIPIVLQIAKFSAVGAFNTFLDWGILNVLIVLFGTAAGVSFALFKGVSFIFANAGSYFWNKYWTFGSKTQANAMEVGKFFIVSFVGLLINVGIASAVVSFVGAQYTNAERVANIGAAVATLVSLIWNFVGYKFIVFVTNEKKEVSGIDQNI